jgi:hypothetical protein
MPLSHEHGATKVVVCYPSLHVGLGGQTPVLATYEPQGPHSRGSTYFTYSLGCQQPEVEGSWAGRVICTDGSSSQQIRQENSQ